MTYKIGEITLEKLRKDILGETVTLKHNDETIVGIVVDIIYIHTDQIHIRLNEHGALCDYLIYSYIGEAVYTVTRKAKEWNSEENYVAGVA